MDDVFNTENESFAQETRLIENEYSVNLRSRFYYKKKWNDGWINVGAIAGEMKDPGKDLPKAIIGGLSLVMGVYVVINLAYLWVLPASELAKYASPASAVAEHLFGPMGGKFITVGILISLFGALNGYLLTGPRIVYTLGEQKNLPAALGKLSKNGVPANATLATVSYTHLRAHET